MSRVGCDIEETELWSDDANRDIPGVCATCQQCGNTTESFGTSESSVRRCLALMREECPEGEENYYVAD